MAKPATLELKTGRIGVRRIVRRYGMLRIASPIVFILLWELYARSGKISPLYLPAPLSIMTTFVEMMVNGRLLDGVIASLSRMLQGFFFGSLIGIVIGMLMGWVRTIEDVMEPIVSALYPIPKTALFPLFMLWFGLGNASKVVTIAAGVLFLVLINTVTGVKGINPILIKAARDLGATASQIFVKVVLPGSLPNIFTGLRLGAGVALLLVFVTEMEATDRGLGFLMWESFQLMLVTRMFACMITFALLGIFSAWFLRMLERLFCPWQE